MEGTERAVGALGQSSDFEGDVSSALETSPCVSAAKVASFPHLLVSRCHRRATGMDLPFSPLSRAGWDSTVRSCRGWG